MAENAPGLEQSPHVFQKIVYRYDALKNYWRRDRWCFIAASSSAALVIPAALSGVGPLGLALLASLWCLGIGLEVLAHCADTLVRHLGPGDAKLVRDAFGTAPASAWTAYGLSWLILVLL